jgi:MoxR-like ATPase
MELSEFSALARRMEGEMARVIVGQRAVLRGVLIGVILGRHVLLEGVPGLGKTMLIRTLADVLALRFSRIQFTPDLMPADIIGTDILEETEEGRRAFRFRPGPIFANLVLADEINRATPKTQSALLEAMQEQTVTVGGQRYPLDAPFFVMATQNPLEMEGTYPLPEAQLDRFLFKLNVAYPSAAELVQIMGLTTGAQQPQAQPVASAEQVLGLRELALSTPIASHVTDYVARLIVATQPQDASAPDLVRRYVAVGASPRGAQALVLGAKVNALLEGRFNVAFDDVKAIAADALRHRLILKYEAQGDGVDADQIIADLLARVRS